MMTQKRLYRTTKEIIELNKNRVKFGVEEFTRSRPYEAATESPSKRAGEKAR